MIQPTSVANPYTSIVTPSHDGVHSHRPHMQYYTYIVTNKPNGTFYTGVTNNLQRRIYEPKEGLADGFTKKYDLKILVDYEIYDDIRNAISREKLIKNWKRSIKIEAIKTINPTWKDLYFEL